MCAASAARARAAPSRCGRRRSGCGVDSGTTAASTSRGSGAGAATAPATRLALRVNGLQVADIAYGVVAVDARYVERVAHLHASLRHPQAGELLVDGDVPVDLAWAGERRDVSGAPLSVTARA